MREDLIVPGEASEKDAMGIGGRVIVEPFTPLIERLKTEKPALIEGLETLRVLVGEDNFEKYINNAQSIKKADDSFMLITDNEMSRTAIERSFIGPIQQAFAVKYVRIVCQPTF